MVGPSARALLATTLLECGEPPRPSSCSPGLRTDPPDGCRPTVCVASPRWPRLPATRRCWPRRTRCCAAIETPPGSAWLPGTDAYTAVARAWLAAGAPDRARAVVAPLLAAAARTGWIPVLAAAGIEDGRAAARLGDAAAARRCWTGPWSWRGHGMPTVAAAAERGDRRRAGRSRLRHAAAQPRRNGGDDAGRTRLTHENGADDDRTGSARRAHVRWIPTGSTPCSGA